MNNHTCVFVICRLELFQSTLNIRFVLNVKDDGFVELKELELDVAVGSAKVSISFMNF